MSKLSSCCVKTTDRTGVPKGKVVDNLYGLKTYESGSKANSATKGVIVISADIYGYDYINNKLAADSLAAAGYYVLLPDLLKEDFCEHAKMGNAGYFNSWLEKHSLASVSTMFADFVTKMKDDLKPKFVGGVGFCFGAKFVITNLGSSGLLDSGAVAHASFITVEDLEKIRKPVLFSCAEVDTLFTPEFRLKAEKILAKNKQRFQIDLFSGVDHGYSVRGDLSIPAIKYAADKTLSDQLYWFDHTS